MTKRDDQPELSDSLEDYLETVYELVRDKKFARVKDIAKARGVRPGSVSPAMRRLADMGLLEYVRREYIGLTPEGEERARRILARHRLLCRLFEDFLQMDSDGAEVEACAMEHSLSDEAMDRLVRFFEFLGVCPEGQDLLRRFHNCPLVQEDAPECETHCAARVVEDPSTDQRVVPLTDLRPGEAGTVAQINGHGDTRRRLIDMGLMPEVVIEIVRQDLVKDEVWISLQGFEITLASDEAAAVMVSRG